MTKDEFLILLRYSSELSYDFAKEYVLDSLPRNFNYSVVLNVSKDDPSLLPQFDIYPSDSNKEVLLINENKVAELLVRKGKVPVWIDINVECVHKGKTIFKLLCAGRYSDNWEEYYYKKGNTGPFGIKSPTFPIDYIEGKKFNLMSNYKKSFFNWIRELKMLFF